MSLLSDRLFPIFYAAPLLTVSLRVVVAPVYLSEIAPRNLRGLCTTTFAGSVYIGIMLAYFANWGCEIHISSDVSTRWVGGKTPESKLTTNLHVS